jgi:HPt (histidine-containing phosphotransfer) domain-containing protein
MRPDGQPQGKEKIRVRIDADLADIVPVFLANRQKDIAKIRAVLAEGNFAEVQRLGHGMKGAGAGYGFPLVTDLGRALEEAARARDAAQIESRIHELETYLSRVEVIYD